MKSLIFLLPLFLFACAQFPKERIFAKCGGEIWTVEVESNSNQIILCKDGSNSFHYTYFSNENYPYPPTSCFREGGYTGSDKEINFAFKETLCKNKNVGPAFNMQCNIAENLMSCDVIKNDKVLEKINFEKKGV